jgi:hypothetical protein
MWKVDASVEPKLTYLNLFRCKVLYPESLADFIKASGKNLEHVDLFNCFLTTADVIVALASVVRHSALFPVVIISKHDGIAIDHQIEIFAVLEHYNTRRRCDCSNR